MADVDITIVTDIEGLDEVEEAFTTGNKRAVKKFLARIEKQAARVLRDSAAENAPYEFGELADDIHMMTVQGDGTLTVRVGPSSKTFYGLFQEFGTEHDPAQHWLENSAKEVQDRVLDEFLTGLQEGLEDMKR